MTGKQDSFLQKFKGLTFDVFVARCDLVGSGSLERRRLLGQVSKQKIEDDSDCERFYVVEDEKGGTAETLMFRLNIPPNARVLRNVWPLFLDGLQNSDFLSSNFESNRPDLDRYFSRAIRLTIPSGLCNNFRSGYNSDAD